MSGRHSALDQPAPPLRIPAPVAYGDSFPRFDAMPDPDNLTIDPAAFTGPILLPR